MPTLAVQIRRLTDARLTDAEIMHAFPDKDPKRVRRLLNGIRSEIAADGCHVLRRDRIYRMARDGGTAESIRRELQMRMEDVSDTLADLVLGGLLTPVGESHYGPARSTSRERVTKKPKYRTDPAAVYMGRLVAKRVRRKSA